ncbi:hypothetical protein J4772_14335 [Cohnella sp. LGH]|uniref:hypothetical protein n=1 Tax=Cohnella sp. LGH TaxID=1619153 RepID=UPI001AD9D395|nr:hypothetical protein [Cohnella sp. LGH]QTH45482.1 hypothetical protein J4772_14335 [Cohnella sp. LGH]
MEVVELARLQFALTRFSFCVRSYQCPNQQQRRYGQGNTRSHQESRASAVDILSPRRAIAMRGTHEELMNHYEKYREWVELDRF